MTDSAAATAPHPLFNLPDADVTLVASDGVLFKVCQAALHAHSSVFNDMFETGSAAGQAEVPLVETSKALEAVLSHCGLGSTYTFDVENDSIWEICRAMHKYDVETGWTALVAAWRLLLVRYNPLLPSLVRSYVFATVWDSANAPELVSRILALRPSCEDVESYLSPLQRNHGLGDGGRLMLLLKDRQLERQNFKFDAMTRTLVKAFEDAVSEEGSLTGWSHALDVWVAAGRCDTAKQARKVVEKNWPGKKRKTLQPAYELMPWGDLYKLLDDLPARLN